MNPKVRLTLQLLMWFVCGTHMAIGLGVNVSPEFINAAASMYGAEPRAWPLEFLHILKPLGAFMMALGAAAALAALDPQKYRPIVYIFVGLFIVRGLQRLAFTQEITDAFGISSGRSMSHLVFFLALALALVVVDQLAHRLAPSTPQAE